MQRRGWWILLIGVVAMMVTLSACGGDDGDDASAPETTNEDEGAPEEDTGDDAAGGSLSVATVDNAFSPTSLSAPPGEVTVEVTNNGENPHTFTIEGVADTSTIQPGSTASVSFTMSDEPLTYFCAVHGEATMSGTIEPG